MMERRERPRIVVTADDFGMSGRINRAIVLAFERGTVSRASIMANMPGFAEACVLADRHGLHGRIGVHLNLSEGTPLTHAIRGQGRFCGASGRFIGRRTMMWLSRAEQDAVEAELDQQIAVVRSRGIEPTHLDSHHHFHTEWAIGTLVIRVARRHGIAAVRPGRNGGATSGVLRMLYKRAYNHRLGRAGVAGTEYYGGVPDVLRAAPATGGTYEVNVHPGLDGRDVVVDRLSGEDLTSVIARLRTVAVVETPGAQTADVVRASGGAR